MPQAVRLEATRVKRNNSSGLGTPAGGGNLSFPFFTRAMTKEEERELRATLARLMQEHRDLDAAIEALENAPGRDRLQIQRLKKRKLQLRDRITFIEDQLTPDIIA
jgi:hypothetical protein